MSIDDGSVHEEENHSDLQPNGFVSQGNGSNIASAQQSTAQEIAKQRSTRAFFRGFWTWVSSNGNALDLFALSLNWCLLDFTFYLLGVNSSSFIPTLFGNDETTPRLPYSVLIDDSRHIMESSSVALLVGGLMAIFLMHFRNGKAAVRHINSPRKVQIWGFGSLTILFIIVGAMYMTLPTTNAHVAIVFFYALANFFFNLGMLNFCDKPLRLGNR